MDSQTFLDNFGTIADAPGGVDRLRELILNLAVRGLLVPQDPVDESARDLLTRAAAARKELIAAGAVPQPRALLLDGIDHAEHAFEIPPTWVWARLDDVAVYIQRGKGPRYVESGGVPVVSQKCIQNSGFDISRARFVDETTLDSYGPERFLRAGDLLWNSTGTGTVGRVNVFPGDPASDRVVADSHVTVVRTAVCSPHYLHCWLAGPDVQSSIDRITTGTTNQQELSTTTARLQPVPLPPRLEQDRIVAKVDELMQLCDDLDARQKFRRHVATRLRAATLNALTNSSSDDELQVAWSRVHTNWEALTDHPDCIDAVRQSILHLAVLGLLAPQDPTETPAAAQLLENARAKSALIRNGQLRAKRIKNNTSTSQQALPLPAGWASETLGNIATLITKGTTPTTNGHAYTASGINFVKVENLRNGRIDHSSLRTFIGEDAHSEQRRSQLEAGDVLFSIAGTIGKTATVGQEDLPANTNQALAIIRGTAIVFAQEFLRLVLDSFVASAVHGRARGGAMANVSLGDLSDLVVPVPPMAEQHRIISQFEYIEGLVDQLAAGLANQADLAAQLAESTCMGAAFSWG